MVDTRVCDLANPEDDDWRSVIKEVGGVVHFAADNPYPEATWREAARSIDMTINTAMAASDARACTRYVFATSNHVMGRHRTAGLEAGELKPDTPEGVGTVWDTGDRSMDSTPYASAKFAGERVCRGLGSKQNGTDFVAIRIGWCQPGRNERSTLSAAGTPTQGRGEDAQDADLEATDRWFKGMWLSNTDMVHLFERALLAPATDWEDGYVLVNGMSNNTRMVWSLDETRAKLGYEPVDDVYSEQS